MSKRKKGPVWSGPAGAFLDYLKAVYVQLRLNERHRRPSRLKTSERSVYLWLVHLDAGTLRLDEVVAARKSGEPLPRSVEVLLDEINDLYAEVVAYLDPTLPDRDLLAEQRATLIDIRRAKIYRGEVPGDREVRSSSNLDPAPYRGSKPDPPPLPLHAILAPRRA